MIEKKSGLYKYLLGGRKEKSIIDIYGSDEGGWFWGYMSDCGNHVSDKMWSEVEYIGETTEQYLANVHALMMCSMQDDNP